MEQLTLIILIFPILIHIHSDIILSAGASNLKIISFTQRSKIYFRFRISQISIFKVRSVFRFVCSFIKSSLNVIFWFFYLTCVIWLLGVETKKYYKFCTFARIMLYSNFLDCLSGSLACFWAELLRKVEQDGLEVLDYWLCCHQIWLLLPPMFHSHILVRFYNY